jgi:hypothetical protein
MLQGENPRTADRSTHADAALAGGGRTVVGGAQGIVAHGRLQSSQRVKYDPYNRPCGDFMPAEIRSFPFAPDAGEDIHI